ncbi:MAG TPA: Hsp20/alpha crystallin family protein [Saprospiraceae bacterium]|nr:Hsp20/alpha crystallin family protein [Saprospiraceae bacterium]
MERDRMWPDFNLRSIFQTGEFWPSGNIFTLEKYPKVNISELDKEYMLELAIPGFDKENLEIEMDNGRIIVHAQKSEEKEESEKNFLRREYHNTSFKRVFDIPIEVDESKIEAEHSKGVLRIVLPKKMNQNKDNKKVSIS